MSTAALCGFAGSVTGATGALEVAYWEITENVNAPDATSLDSEGWRERVPCVRKITGSFKAIGHCSIVGGKAGCVFKDAQSGGYSITANIIITKITIGTPVDNIVTFNHEFDGTGSYTVSSGIV